LIVSDGELVIELEKLREAYAASQRVHDVLASWLPEAVPAQPSRLAFPKRETSRDAAPVGVAANPNAELVAEYETERKRIPRRAWDRDARIIARVHGDSMDGGADPIKDGELAYLKRTRDPRKANGHVALVRRDDGLYLKKFERSGQRVRLVSMNGEPTLELDARAENMQIYGYVVDHGPER
jgi:phage repressor protein C with HTH and peptisase S24 domain